MKGKARKIIINTGVTFIFVLVISTAVQFIMWTQAERNIDLMLHTIAIDGDSGVGVHEQIRNLYGLNKPFVPDLWPFDNRSIWTGRNIWTGK